MHVWFFWVCVRFQWENWVINPSALKICILYCETIMFPIKLYQDTLTITILFFNTFLKCLDLRVVPPFSRIGQLSNPDNCSRCSGHYHHRSGISTVNHVSCVLMILIFSNTENGWSGQQKYKWVALLNVYSLQWNSLVSSTTFAYKPRRKCLLWWD